MAELLYLDRKEAIMKLRHLVGVNLRPMAEQYGVTIFKPDAGFNKGWVGHTLEAYLELPRNSLRTGDFMNGIGPWELKTVALRQSKGLWIPKETLAITMISQNEVLPDFYESHLYAKIRRLVVVGRAFVNREETEAQVVYVHPFDADAPENAELLQAIKQDYDEVREVLGQEDGYSLLRGRMGIWVQPRTKGPGHGSTSRAFYARKNLVRFWLKLLD